MDVIATHENADFDGVAALVAARHLFPGAVVVCPALLDRSVREYVTLHRDELGLVASGSIEVADVRRVILVDTSDLSRLGPLAALKGDEVEVVVLDHHSGAGADAAIVSTDGALITTLLEVLGQRSIDISPAEATLFALGIHQDTGSLTYESTTARDAEALASCYRRGADLSEIERYTRFPLGASDRALLRELLAAIETVVVDGTHVQVAAVSVQSFIDGAANVVDKLADLTEARALVVLLEHADKTSCIVRSRGSALDAGALAAALGGGGHPGAAAATVAGDLAHARAAVAGALPAALRHGESAGELMSSPPIFVTARTSITEAMAACRGAHIGGLLVGSRTSLEGVVSREDLDGALAHGLGHAPVVSVVNAVPPTVQPDAPLAELRSLLAKPRTDRVAVESAGEIVGVVTRRDLLSGRDPADEHRRSRADERSIDVVDLIPALAPVVAAIDALPEGHGGAYLVGGGVRDALLGVDVVDLDIAVEGSGVELAEALAAELGGRATTHADFGTATVTFTGGVLDVATTRSELYNEPGALPTVDTASIERDLFRRDFTINAMAIALAPAARGRLIDPYGGERDLSARTLRVLHNLSFVDDPTRLLRAARYEARYGFVLDAHSETLARTCVELGLVSSLSEPRVGNELALLLGEENGVAAVERLAELGVLTALHPQLDTDPAARQMMERVEAAAAELDVVAPVWRLRLAILTRALPSSERYLWLDGLQLARRDAKSIAEAATLAPAIASRLADPASAPELYRILSPAPIEAVLLALGEVEPGSRADEALRRFVTELRHVDLTIDGEDLAELGLPESPAVGEILDAVRALKLDGAVSTRDDELDAARRLIESRELV